jgi:putative SOS response-associated peptidase YedK
MKTLEELETRMKELARQTAAYSQESVNIRDTDRKKSRELFRMAYETSKRCAVLMQEFNRRRKMEE